MITASAPKSQPTDPRLDAAYLRYLAVCARGSQSEIETALLQVQAVERKVGLTEHLTEIRLRVFGPEALS